MPSRSPSRLVAAAALLALTAAGCGATVIATNTKNARIYVDGREVGRGHAEVRRRGLPGSATIVVKAPDGRETTARMSRHFTLTTALVGLFTYGIGLITAWEYPGSVFVPLANKARSKSSWDSNAGSEWMKPPPGWKPPRQRAPTQQKAAAPQPGPASQATPPPRPGQAPNAAANKPANKQPTSRAGAWDRAPQ